MVAQTSLPQAADQFCRAYRQLLIYDHEEYDNDYDLDNLEGSLIAGSIVATYDSPGVGFTGWLGVMAHYASDGLGYEDGSSRQQTLNSTQSFLGNAWRRIKSAASHMVHTTMECMGDEPIAFLFTCVAAVGFMVALFVDPTKGGLAALYGGGALATLCIAAGVAAFASTLFFGGISIPWRRKPSRLFFEREAR